MYKQLFAVVMAVGVAAMAGTAWAVALNTSAELQVKVIAEVEAKSQLTPAERVMPGDYMIYTLEVTNVGSRAVANPVVTNPVPAHMLYIADSAVGPGAEVTFSVDGGRSFDRPENLQLASTDAGLRPAVAADYTHIRWQLRNALKAQSIAFVRFRTRVK